MSSTSPVRPAPLPAPSVTRPSPNTSWQVDSRLVGVLRTNLVAVGLRTAFSGTVPAHFLVANGTETGTPEEWTFKTFPFTAEGERLARARFTALVDGAAVAQQVAA
jgi:hypothetical protein